MYIGATTIQREYELSRSTLVKWADEKTVRSIRTPGGKRLYHKGDIQAILHIKDEDIGQEKENIIYARVSSSHQKEDLQRQIDFLQKEYPNFKVISDIGSGLNYKRRGLQAILELVYQGRIRKIVVAYKDRLCRFGFEIFESIFKHFEVKFMVHNSCIGGSTAELSEDLLSIVNVFVARQNGRRAKRKRLDHTQDQASTQIPTKEHSQAVDGRLSIDLQPLCGGKEGRAIA